MKLSTYIFGSIALLIQYYADKYEKYDFDKTLVELEKDLNIPRIKTYDFIVVGSGTAGSLVAGRLSQNFSVLLLESGGIPVPATYPPALKGFIYFHPAINNVFTSVPQTNFAQERCGIVKPHTGRMLGGSGSHNGNYYIRGSPHDYDRFASLTADDSWSYKNVLAHFKRFERFYGKLVNESQREHFYGTTGEISVESDWAPIITAWFQAGEELGFKAGDPNGFQEESFTTMTKSTRNGEKSSTYTELLKPLDFPGSPLTVMKYSTVDKILVNENNTAYGVVYKRHGIPQIAHASKEVIVSCGAFQSPLLLIKSGIGPQAVLQDAKIPELSLLEGVGKNFRDHGAVSLNFVAKTRNTTLLPLLDETQVEAEIERYQTLNRGGFYAQRDVTTQAFIISSRAKKDGEEGWPDIQLIFFPRASFGSSALTLQVILGRPKSFGEVRFNTTAWLNGETNDTQLAIIDYQLFTDPSDIDVLIEGIKLGYKLMENTTIFATMGMTNTDKIPEACKNLVFKSDEYWRCYIKQRAGAWNHLGGTCKMGQDNDTMAVVDSKLRVRGVKKLRVVDASVFPFLPNVNINAPVILLAEKASQDILAHYLPNMAN